VDLGEELRAHARAILPVGTDDFNDRAFLYGGRMRRILLAAPVAVLALAAAAGAAIVPQKGIAGVSLGMTQAQVRSVLGKPPKVKHGTGAFGPYTKFQYPGLVVTFQGKVSDVTTTRSSERTSTGVGVGSKEADVRAKVKGVKCKTESGGFRHCYVGSFLPGKRVTDFRIKHGKVTSVEVGFVSD
jgi:hypothetical protein